MPHFLAALSILLFSPSVTRMLIATVLVLIKSFLSFRVTAVSYTHLGIGEVKAQAIIAYREAYGPFRSVEELTLVKGIGEKTLQKLLPYICV